MLKRDYDLKAQFLKQKQNNLITYVAQKLTVIDT